MAGLVGSFSHCSVMCSPMVAAQMLGLHQQHRPVSLIMFYHAGRITTYILLGLLAIAASQSFFQGALEPYTHWLLVLAGMVFLASAILPRKTHSCCAGKLRNLHQQLHRLSFVSLSQFLKGMLMGLMPCGMVYAMLLMVATLQHWAQAASVMLLFGLATLPVLQVIGYGALRLGARHPQLSSRLSRGVLALNGLFLCSIGIS